MKKISLTSTRFELITKRKRVSLEKKVDIAELIKISDHFVGKEVPSQLVSYDEKLLVSSRTQSQFGDWARLVATGHSTHRLHHLPWRPHPRPPSSGSINGARLHQQPRQNPNAVATRPWLYRAHHRP